MLPIGIHEYNHTTFGSSSASLYCRPIAFAIRMRYHSGPRGSGDDRSIITGAIIHYNHLRLWMQGQNTRDSRANSTRFIFRRQNNRNADIGHKKP